ncbi:MAG TPA: PP2C family serine/threonine-protein phosphatase, partial [Marinobacter sp.]|nr:PP2C family serine/threonine-protein phosphatase [Marinobacter sp.]
MVLGNRLRLSVDQASHQGVKPRNEDCIGIRIPDDDALSLKGACAIIADGVSAAAAGKEASEACVTGFLSDYFCTPDSWSVKHSAHKVLTALNQWLCSQGQRSADEGGYITTLSTLILKSTRAHLFHVGDSRVYRLRAGALEQLTTDHQVRVRRDLTYLARGMGMTMNLEIDYRTVDLETGDLFLLTTDGIHDLLPHAELTTWLRALPDTLQGSAANLVQTALDRGSNDNLSCQLIRVDSLGLDDTANYESLSRLPFPPPLSVGQTLDGYTVQGILHESTRSQAYRVRHADQPNTDLVMKTP